MDLYKKYDMESLFIAWNTIMLKYIFGDECILMHKQYIDLDPLYSPDISVYINLNIKYFKNFFYCLLFLSVPFLLLHTLNETIGA